MAGKGRSGQRIEPSFAGKPARAEDELTLDADDRIGGRSPGKAAPKGRENYPKGRNTARHNRGRNRQSERREGLGFIGTIRRMVYWCLVLLIWVGIGLGGMVLYYGSRMPSASTWQIPARPPNVKINAMDGTSLANRGATGGEALTLEEMSPFIPEAIVAIEDRRFYSHFGVDPIGLARAFATNLVTGHTVQGGSTLTQQLAKNLFLSPERTMERKVQEVLLALWLEHTYTKDQILAMYLNRVFFGSNAFGVEAASRRYFNKSARDVNLGEAAMLAGLVKAPSKLSPIRDPAAAAARQQIVLQAMRDQGYVTDADIKTALAAPPTRAKSFWNGAQNYAADMVMDQLPGLIGNIKEDVVVDTTIDMSMEAKAEQALGDVLDHDGKKLDASQGALVSVDATGAIRAMVGGRDYAESQFNRAVTAKRQPGSAFKPFVYAAAMEMGLTPTSVRNDAPVKIGNWTPENYEQKYSGVVTLATALAHSLNTIAAQLVMEVGPANVIKLAHRVGIESELQDNASIALGTSEVSLLELTSSYAAFMNGGYKATPHVITKVTSASGKVLYDANFSDPPRVLSAAVVTNMNYMMENVMAIGTGKSAKIPGWQAAGKSGTTQSFRDALFVGFTSDLTTGVWFGNDDGKSMKKVTGGGLPAKAWKEFMVAAHKGLTPAPLFGNGQMVDNDMPMAQVGGNADQSTISSIISGVLGGGTTASTAARTPSTAVNPPASTNPAVVANAPPVSNTPPAAANPPTATIAPRQVPVQPPTVAANNEVEDMPPVGPGPDNNPYASQSPTPPADIGESPAAARPHRTTLLDYLMGR